MDDPMETGYEELFSGEIAAAVPSNIREFTKKLTNYWISKFNRGVLSSSDFEDHWKVWVTNIYTPPVNETCLNWTFNEDLSQDILLNPLEDFICNGDSSIILKQISNLDKAPSVSILVDCNTILIVENYKIKLIVNGI